MLLSAFLRNNSRLQKCLVDDSAHVTKGAQGDFVALIQHSLVTLDHSFISESEIRAKNYGQTTAAAVLAYKKRRNIVNLSYQSQADDIVGKFTIAAMDRELLVREVKRNVLPQTADSKIY